MNKNINIYTRDFRNAFFVIILMLCCSSCEKKIVENQSINSKSSQISHNNLQKEEEKTDNNTQTKLENEVDFFELPENLEISGNHFKAIEIAYEAFKSNEDIPDDKRNIENYEIQLRQTSQIYFVLFSANMTKTDISDGGETSLGRDVMYKISKKDFSIKGSNFFK